MQFELDEDRALLKQSTRELLDKEAPLEESRRIMEDSDLGFSKTLYAQLAELGYLGLTLTEAEGGAEVGCIGLVAVLEEMGRAAFPGPYLDLVLASEALRACDCDLAREWLGRIVAGDAIAVIARRDTLQADDAAPASAVFDGKQVAGSKLFVPFGSHADALIVTTRQGLVLVPRPGTGWNATPLETLDHAQRFVEIQLALPGTRLADAEQAQRALARVDRVAALGGAALALGLMERSLEMATQYTLEREAFGVPIATFQVLQHRQAEMFLQTEASRAAVYRAAWAVDSNEPNAALLVAAAKAYAGRAARFVCGASIQLHGGVGFTWEYDPHIFLKRTKTLEEFYGTTHQQLENALSAAGIA